jgi:hypothetical protein
MAGTEKGLIRSYRSYSVTGPDYVVVHALKRAPLRHLRMIRGIIWCAG